MNLNDLAIEVSKREGKKEQLSIAQIKEVLKIALSLLKKLSVEELTDVLKRVK